MKRSKNMKIVDKSVKNFIEQSNKIKMQEKIDLSSDEDLSLAIMNLISIEEHLFFTGAKTGKTKYYELLKEVRELRKNLLKTLVKHYEGEVWCISKHLLAASMRLIEVGTKQLNQNNDQKANELFGQAYQLYTLFWKINLEGNKTEKDMRPQKKCNISDSSLEEQINCCLE